MWSAIVASVLRIFEYALKLFVSKSDNADITNAEKSRKQNELHDDIKSTIDKALKDEDKDALEKLRKYISD